MYALRKCLMRPANELSLTEALRPLRSFLHHTQTPTGQGQQNAQWQQIYQHQRLTSETGLLFHSSDGQLIHALDGSTAAVSHVPAVPSVPAVSACVYSSYFQCARCS